MDTTIDVLSRALRGDAGALSFLERTSSIYILDATSPSQPKTYGSWNFVNESLNEIDRIESTVHTTGRLSLEGHVQLLAAMCQRSARRSPAMDRRLVGTCLANAAHYHGSRTMDQSLVEINSQLRERVMGRIAAMVFDFSYHRGGTSHSSFANPLAMESLCAILAANAVSSGAANITHFMMDWIVPSVDNMPPSAVVAVTLNIACEAMGRSAPEGTQKSLLQVTPSVVSIILGPMLKLSISEESGPPNNRLAALTLRAIERWCTATSLREAQIKFLCSKTNINFIEVLSDAFYSDSELVVDALADLTETLFERAPNNADLFEISRLIMRETRSSSTVEEIQLEQDRARAAVLHEVIQAVGLQRFRFAGRHTRDGDGVYRCLARIVSAVFRASYDGLQSAEMMNAASGMIDVLLKASGHPSVHVCSIALQNLPALLSLDPNLLGLDPPVTLRVLPVLQQRAIIPHHFVNGARSLDAAALCGVDFHEFEQFRENLLQDVLVSCYLKCPRDFIDSCTSAVEEFCGSALPVDLSFQLEAALFCLGAVSFNVINTALHSQDMEEDANDLQRIHDTNAHHHEEQMTRCLMSLARKPECMSSNPLTLAQTCRYLSKHAKWLTNSLAPAEVLNAAADLSMHCFSTATMASFRDTPANAIVNEMTSSPFAEASRAVQCIMYRAPARFANPNFIATLGGAWQSVYTDRNSAQSVSVEDREALCSGVCVVLAALPSDQWTRVLGAFSLPTIECMESLAKSADEINNAGQLGQQDVRLHPVLDRLATEINILACIVRSFARAIASSPKARLSANTAMEGSTTKPHPSMEVVRRVWPCISHLSQGYASHEGVASSILNVFRQCIPLLKLEHSGANLMGDIASTMSTIANELIAKDMSLTDVSDVVLEVLDVYESNEDGSMGSPTVHHLPLVHVAREFVHNFTALLYAASVSSMGSAWRGNNEQNQGQKPFESRSSTEAPPSDIRQTSGALEALFTLLTQCVSRFPMVIVQFQPKPGCDHTGDVLLCSAMQMAVDCINSSEITAARAAMMFLNAAAELPLLQSNQATETMAEDSAQDPKGQIATALQGALSEQRQDILKKLVAGCCGLFHRTLLDPAAVALYTILRGLESQEAEMCSRLSLKQDMFLLGDRAKDTTLVILCRCSSGALSPSVLMDYVDELWQMHQHEEGGTVAGNEVVGAFLERYQSHVIATYTQ